ncbi:MAG: TlyA family RNA methyltransferase [Lachnospiraceae bacterium]|nr:TlyA family RNA methyltransferase [Lachnospiraceae bacterium]
MKERLDVLLVKDGYAPSREKAKAIIMSGNVYVNGQKEDKAGTFFDESKIKSLEVRGAAPKYVSRGGLKLEKAMEIWGFFLDECVCMDIGASTGGFTDCMLQKGASKVYSVDVGHGQLAWKLRNDSRVVVMEQTNFRFMKPEDIEDALDFASVDVSFISLTKILIPARNLLKNGGQMVCLIKPQFEAGREKVGKNGVVREPETHREVISKIVTYADMIGFDVKAIDFSPIKGPEGNIEYLMHIIKRDDIAEDVAALTEGEAEDKLDAMLAEGNGLAFEDEFKKLIDGIVSQSHEL